MPYRARCACCPGVLRAMHTRRRHALGGLGRCVPAAAISLAQVLHLPARRARYDLQTYLRAWAVPYRARCACRLVEWSAVRTHQCYVLATECPTCPQPPGNTCCVLELCVFCRQNPT